MSTHLVTNWNHLMAAQHGYCLRAKSKIIIYDLSNSQQFVICLWLFELISLIALLKTIRICFQLVNDNHIDVHADARSLADESRQPNQGIQKHLFLILRHSKSIPGDEYSEYSITV